MSSRIEQLIDDIEEYIDSCKFQPFSSNKIIVNKDDIQDLIHELRAKTPDEIKRVQRIIQNKDEILNDARSKAEQLINEATIQTTELISEHEILQQAYAQANEVVLIATKQAQEILDNATNEANNVRMGAMNYTDQQLQGIEEILTHSIDTSRMRYENLIQSLQGYLDIVTTNRAQLFPSEEAAPKEEPKKETPDVIEPVDLTKED